MQMRYKILILMFVVGCLVAQLCLVACSTGLERDRSYWNEHRLTLVALSDKLIILSRRTGLTMFSKDAVGGNDYKQRIPLKDISSKYPASEELIRDIVHQLKLTRFHWISVTPDYVEFFRSGGLCTDTILLHLRTDKGLSAFEEDLKKNDGPKIQEKMTLEKDWLFIYTD